MRLNPLPWGSVPGGSKEAGPGRRAEEEEEDDEEDEAKTFAAPAAAP